VFGGAGADASAVGSESPDVRSLVLRTEFDGFRGLLWRAPNVEKVAGGTNGVLVDEDGWLHGAARWRADGVPIGISGGQSRASTESGVPY